MTYISRNRLSRNIAKDRCNIAVQMCSKPAIKGALQIHKNREVSRSGYISLNLFTISADVLPFSYLPHSEIRKFPKVWRNDEIEFCKLSKYF